VGADANGGVPGVKGGHDFRRLRPLGGLQAHSGVRGQPRRTPRRSSARQHERAPQPQMGLAPGPRPPRSARAVGSQQVLMLFPFSRFVALNLAFHHLQVLHPLISLGARPVPVRSDCRPEFPESSVIAIQEASKNKRTGSGRVSNLYPGDAVLAFLACLPECRISNLQIPSTPWGFKSPSPHHNLKKNTAPRQLEHGG
jgi:hypothetical protein